MQPPGNDSQAMLPDTAEGWMARLSAHDCSPEERAAFEDWRAADPERMLAFAEVEYLHETAAQLAGDPLLRAASRRKVPPARNPWVWRASAIAAVLLAALGLAIHVHGLRPAAAVHYASAATLQTIRLDDGTRMQLDAASAVTVRFDRAQRIVDLDAGRAEFDVAADRERPFEVRAGGTTIHDIGTVFQVSRDGQQVSVGLLEGRVEVSGERNGQAWHRQLEPAQKIRIGADGQAGSVMPLDVAAARAWPLGELVFHQRRLDELLVEANRYSTTQLRLGDSSLASLRVSGSIHAGDSQTLVKALENGWQIQAARAASGDIVLRRGAKKPD